MHVSITDRRKRLKYSEEAKINIYALFQNLVQMLMSHVCEIVGVKEELIGTGITATLTSSVSAAAALQVSLFNTLSS